MGGWIKFYRQILDSEVWKNKNFFILWTYILLKSAHRPTSVRFRHYSVKLDRGEIVSSRSELALMTGLSEKNIRTALEFLKRENMISVYDAKLYIIIRISKFEEFQATNGDFDGAKDITNNEFNIEDLIQQNMSVNSERPSKRPSKRPSETANNSTTYDEERPSKWPSKWPSNSAERHSQDIDKHIGYWIERPSDKNIKKNKNNNNIIYYLKNTKNLNEIQKFILILDKNIENSLSIAEEYMDNRIKSRWYTKDGKQIDDVRLDIMDFLITNYNFNHIFRNYCDGKYSF